MYRTEADFRNGVDLLRNCILDLTDGVEFKIASTTTNSYKKFKEETERNGYLTISEEGCSNTIYDSPEINIRSRVWHDLIHLKHELDFSFENEQIVCEIQQKEMCEWAEKKNYKQDHIEAAYNILYHDIVGQALYYEEYKRFVPYQKLFVMDQFLNLY